MKTSEMIEILKNRQEIFGDMEIILSLSYLLDGNTCNIQSDQIFFTIIDEKLMIDNDPRV